MLRRETLGPNSASYFEIPRQDSCFLPPMDGSTAPRNIMSQEARIKTRPRGLMDAGMLRLQ